MDDACRFWSGVAPANGPRAHLLLSCSEVGLQVQQRVGRPNQLGHAWLIQAQVGQEHVPLLRILKLGDVRLDGRAQDQHASALLFRHGAHAIHMGISTDHGPFVDVAHVQDGLGRQQLHLFHQGLFELFQFETTGTLPLLQMLDKAGEERHLFDGVLVPRLGRLLDLGHARLHRFQILELKFDVDDLFVPDGIDAPVDVHNVVVLEAAQHVQNGVRRPDVAQELVAQTFPFARAFDQAGDVHNFNRGRHHVLGIDQLRQFVQSVIGHGDDTEVGFDGAKREIRTLRLRVGKTVEKGRFAHIGQADDAALQSHGVCSIEKPLR